MTQSNTAQKINVLLIGSGAREHALAFKIKQSSICGTLYVAPGNGGTGKIAVNTNLNITNHSEVVEFCKKNTIGLVMVGPEAPLVAGIADILRKNNILVFGPGKIGAQLEGSKAFTKEICDKYNIPTAKYRKFTASEINAAYDFIKDFSGNIVIKADGLAQGKGVIIASNQEEAKVAIDKIFIDKEFGDAGSQIVIEEFLEGEEISAFAIADGNRALYFGSAQDHKRIGEGDTGLNTGGMGAYAPAPIMNQNLQDQIMQEIINKTLQAMQDSGEPYIGVFFAGLMITKSGPKLIEFNCRFGDPETEVLMLRLESDLLPILIAAASGDISQIKLKTRDQAALCVVIAANGYPLAYKTGEVIENLDLASNDNVQIFHAGTKLNADGKIVSNGGRVLAVTGLGNDVATAKANAYEAVAKITWPGGYFRRDIGWRAL